MLLSSLPLSLVSVSLACVHRFGVFTVVFAVCCCLCLCLIIVVVVVLVVVVTSDVEAAFGIFGDDSSGEEGDALSIVLVFVLCFLLLLVLSLAWD